jgi:glutamate dehydrogenase
MDWLRKQARFLPADDQWQSEATNGLVDQLYSSQAALTLRVLRDTAGKAGKGETLWQIWTALQNGKVERLEPVFDSIRNAGTVDLPMLIIAEQRLRGLAGD